MNSEKRNQRMFSVILGVLITVTGAFPAAVIVGLLYRFPVPVAGWVSGPEFIGSHGLAQFIFQLPGFVISISIAVVVYGIMGAYVVLAAIGAIGGWIVHPTGPFNYRQAIYSNLKIALVADMLFALVMANLDLFITF